MNKYYQATIQDASSPLPPQLLPLSLITALSVPHPGCPTLDNRHNHNFTLSAQPSSITGDDDDAEGDDDDAEADDFVNEKLKFESKDGVSVRCRFEFMHFQSSTTAPSDELQGPSDNTVIALASSSIKLLLDKCLLAVEAPFPSGSAPFETIDPDEDTFETRISGTVLVCVQHDGPVEVKVATVGTLTVDTHKLALGWIRGGPASMRSANAKAAEPIHRMVYVKRVRIWPVPASPAELGESSFHGGIDASFRKKQLCGKLERRVSISLPFAFTISRNCPSSIESEFYKIDYNDSHSIFNGKHAAQRAGQHHRSAVSSVSAIGESFDGLITAAAECDAAEYLMYTGGTNGTGDPDRVAHLHVSVTTGGDVERVDGVSAVFKQRTEFRYWTIVVFLRLISPQIYCLEEDLENRTVVSEVKIHVPANTRTLVRKPLPTETSSHRASMRNSVQLSIDANTELDALVSRTGEPISKSAGLSASGTSSLLKRKNSLPDADAALVATAASVKSGTNGHHSEKYRAGIASFFGKFLAVELKQPISGDPEDDGAHANCAPATKAPSLAYFRTTSMAAQRTLALAIDMPLQPKDWVALGDRDAEMRLPEIVRSHFAHVRVAYRVRRDRIGPLRCDRYVEVDVPLRLLVSRQD
ncbi:hypothetical protein HDU82_003634 [Entophlyctis luteolus]|nr:hypothetical protein HDU82_003634 [Entophlyctis luteolus]